jgi:hypothetical protein
VALPSIDQVLPVDVVTREFGTPITVEGAYSVTISPDARTAYVLGNRAAAPYWTLTTLALPSGEIQREMSLDRIPQGGPVSGPVVTPDGSRLLLGSGGFLDVIDPTTSTVERTIDLPFPGAYGTSLTPDGRTALLTSEFNGLLLVDLPTGSLGPTISVPAYTSAVAPDGRVAYITSNLGRIVTPFDLTTQTAGAPIPLPFGPYGIELDPDGAFAVMSSGIGMLQLDISSGVVTGPTGPSLPLWQVLTPSGRTALVVSQSPDALTSIDVTTGASAEPISLPSTPLGVGALSADQAPVAAASADPSAAGQPTTFDASSSTTPCGEIASYSWDFGDGSEVMTTTAAIVEHTYAAGGDYTATLRVTNTAGTSTTKVFTGRAMNRNGGPEAQTAIAVAVPPAETPPAGAINAIPAFTG